MDYRLEILSEDEFEALVNTLCQRVLGTGVVRFSKGKDGGRDGRFTGIANNFPSNSSPWTGKFIIQAKHTTDYQASCSDKPFFGNQTSIINKEIVSVKELTATEEINNYLLFTNRKETESRESANTHIKTETRLINVDIIGKETLNSWLSQNRDIVKQFGLDKFIVPFDFYDKDIKDVIVIFHDVVPNINNKNNSALIRPDINDKNKLNNLDTSYYENIIVSDLDRYHEQILNFLEDPRNEEYTRYYEETSIELKRVIETNINEFDDFKKVFDFLVKYLLDKEPERLKKYRNTIVAFFHFMYYRCDIGRNK